MAPKREPRPRSRKRKENDPLSAFHPIVRTWFSKTLGTPSAPQREGWPAIAASDHTLILAPTGTGKTLAAFLWAFLKAGYMRSGTLPVSGSGLTTATESLANVLASERRSYRFTHRDDRILPRGDGIIPNVQFYAIEHGDPAPAPLAVVIARNRLDAAGVERGREQRGDPSLQRVTGHGDHLALDDLQRLSLTLADLDRQQLKQMAVIVRRRRSLAFGTIDQAAGDVEANRAGGRRGASRGIGGTNAGGIDEPGDVRGQTPGVPGGVPRVRAQQRD